MKKNWLEIYGLAVCFFTVACFAIVIGIATWDVVQVAAPEFTMTSDAWEKHQSDETFRAALIDEHRVADEKGKYVPPEGAALSKARQDSLDKEIRSERRTGFQDLMQHLIILLIDLLVFAAHWKIAARARHSAG